MDPLSISAAVLGILGAAAKISSALYTFTSNTKSAPKLAQIVLSEVTSTTTVLSQLQQFLLGQTAASKSRASLILVEQVIVTLKECVTTFSDLEDVLDTSKSGSEVKNLDRLRWAMKESKVSAILTRLQGNKSTMTLMLTILQCRSMNEAESAMDRLCHLVEQVLANNQDMSRRLRAMDGEPIVQPDQAQVAGTNDVDDDDDRSSFTATPAERGEPEETRTDTVQRNALGFAFEEELMASRVYKRPLYSQSGESLVTSATRNTASSILSALSMSDVTNISVLAVPIYAHEISNSQRYTFGDFSIDPLAAPIVHVQTAEASPKSKKWGLFSNVVRRGRRPQKHQNEGVPDPDQEDNKERILGVPLKISISYANVAISRTTVEGESYIYGYVPIYMAKIGIFLKEKALEVENIFSISGSPKRLKLLETEFNSPPKYGKGLDWSGFTVHDAANIMIRFLAQMPEPVIPTEFYQRFQQPLREYPAEALADFLEKCESEPGVMFGDGSAIVSYKELIRKLHPSSKQLLLYLLDIMSVFGDPFSDTSKKNNMTPARLATIFQPVILSPVHKDEDNIEDPVYRRLSRSVVQFLIWHYDFLLDVRSQPATDAIGSDFSKYEDEIVPRRLRKKTRGTKDDLEEPAHELEGSVPEPQGLHRRRSF